MLFLLASVALQFIFQGKPSSVFVDGKLAYVENCDDASSNTCSSLLCKKELYDGGHVLPGEIVELTSSVSNHNYKGMNETDILKLKNKSTHTFMFSEPTKSYLLVCELNGDDVVAINAEERNVTENGT